MKITTKVFGEVDIEESKILHFPQGIVGFPELTDFALIHDIEKEGVCAIRWLQSMQEPSFAMPVMDPLAVKPDYNPIVEDELLKLRIENAYLKELRRLRLEDEAKMKDLRESSTASEDNSN